MTGRQMPRVADAFSGVTDLDAIPVTLFNLRVAYAAWRK
jgi:hypothetical protein